MEERFAVVASAGSYLQEEDGETVRLPHRWTPGGVGVRSGCGRRSPVATS